MTTADAGARPGPPGALAVAATAAAATTWPPAPWAGVLVILAALALFEVSWAVFAWGAACAAIALVRWKVGVFLWIATAATVLTPVFRYRNSVVLVGTALLAVLLALRLARAAAERTWSLPRSKLTVPLLAVALTAVLAGVQGTLLYDPNVPGAHRYLLVQIYAVALIVLPVAAVFLVADVVSTAADVAWLMRIVTGIALLFSLELLFRVFVFDLPHWHALLLAHAIAFVYARVLFGPALAWPLRLLGTGFVGWVLWGTVLHSFLDPAQGQWLSGWLMLVPPIVVLTLLRFPRLVLAVSLPAAAALVYFQLPAILRVYHVALREGDLVRLHIWRDALSMMLMRPLLGIGPGNYMDYSHRYARVDLPYGSAHGNYQQIAAEMGILGLLFVLWLLARAFAAGWRTFRCAADPWQRTFAVAAIAVLCGQLIAATVGDYLVPAYHNAGYRTVSVTIYNWVLLGGLMAVEVMREKEKGRVIG